MQLLNIYEINQISCGSVACVCLIDEDSYTESRSIVSKIDCRDWCCNRKSGQLWVFYYYTAASDNCF